MASSERINFDHTACYRDNVHENSKNGRQWCRREGLASWSSRAYAVGNEPAPGAALAANSAPQHDAEARERRASAARRYRPAAIGCSVFQRYR